MEPRVSDALGRYLDVRYSAQARPYTSYPDALCADPDRLRRAYADGVPMGGELYYLDEGTIAAALAARQQL